ncbi:hypothetical protein [Paenibacillus kobensis]|uniref:hypothetical protein n=1 Tax=Paenibacillus kobensis TaxID=59841 RepID=UPI000FD6C896|nr:hypothetical protein [Paenibacillus kobensis]
MGNVAAHPGTGFAPRDGRGSSRQEAFLCWAYLCFLLLLTIYQDFPLKNMIGEIGRTPIIMMMPVFAASEVHLLLRSKKLRLETGMQKNMLLFVLYLAFVSLTYVMVQYMQANFALGSEKLLVKAIKVLIYFLLILLYVRHMHRVLHRASMLGVLHRAFWMVFLFLMAVMLVELATIPRALTFLHSSPNPYWRVRLLTSESSTTGTIMVVFGAVLLELSRKLHRLGRQLANIGVVAGVGLYAAVTSSKGFLIVLFLTVIIMMLRMLDIRRARNIVMLVVIGSGAYFAFKYLSGGVISSLQNDMQNYTSLYTRLGTVLIAVITVLHHPFGVGTGAFVIYFNTYLDTAIDWMGSMFNTLMGYTSINTTELATYADSDKNLGVKSGFFQWIMYGGAGALLFFTHLFRWTRAHIGPSVVLMAAFIFILLSLLFISLDIKYEVWLFFTFIGVSSIREDAARQKRDRFERSNRLQ